MSSPFILVLVGLALGAVLGVLASVLAGRSARRAERQELGALRGQHASVSAERDALRTEREQARIAEARAQVELSGLRQRYAATEQAAAGAAHDLKALQRELSEAQAAGRETVAQLSAERERAQQLMHAEQMAAAARLLAEREAAETRAALERCAADEKLALLTEARVELANQFKTLAAEIFEEKSKRFGEQNHTQMDSLLGPLREKLGEFQLKVEGLQNEGVAGRTELRTHIETLSKLNDRLSAEASSLASALKGSSKKQGDWGEVLLEKMLEDSGLRKGQEYRVQESFTREDGTRARPDVILNLPGEKHLVIDAKVSLVDYNAYCDCEDDASRALSLAKHIGSLRQHLRGLSKKDYHAIYELQSIDFVIMFVPIEPAYLLALAKDGRLWQDAWECNVLLVSPGSLFPVIRTVAHLWRQEQQNRNVEEIVERGALLYDKLANFAGDMVKIGAGLETARESYDKAMNKLATGRGNAISQAEKLKAFGVKASKRMPKEMLESLQEELAHALIERGEEVPGVTRELFD